MVVVAVVVVDFYKAYMCIFLARFLIDRCQIVTDICTKNVRNSVRKSFKSPFSLRN